MISIFLKYFFITLCGFYSYQKISNTILNNSKNYIITVITSGTIAFTISLLSQYNVSLRLFVMLIFSYISILFFTKSSPYITFVILLISFGLNFVFYTLSGVFISFVFLILYKTANTVPYSQTDIPISILQFIIMYFIFQIDRFRKGISLLIKTNSTYIGTFISASFIIYIAIVSTNTSSSSRSLRIVVFLLATLFALLLPVYWNHRITQTYKEKLRLANEKSLEDEIKNKDAEILALQADNERLSKIVHRDNKLVPAMELAVTEFLQNSSNLSIEELNSLGSELSTQLHNMAKERHGILEASRKAALPLPHSGSQAIDGVLLYMETRAKDENIAYKINIDDNIQTLNSDAISEDDLRHLLSDLIENAIIATRYSERPKHILVHLGTLQNHFLLEISDSGVPFDIESYQRFGNEQHTTHKEHGGSGIGLMDIWKLKKKYKASLQIYEYPPDASTYAKKISFVFDRKNHFLLQTYRYKEVTYALTRGDLYVFPYKTE